MIRRFIGDENGATAIEYSLIIAVISMAIVGGASAVGSNLQFLWGNNASRLVQALK